MGTESYVLDLLYAFSSSQLHLEQHPHKVKLNTAATPFVNAVMQEAHQAHPAMQCRPATGRARHLRTLLHDLVMHLLGGAENLTDHVLCS